jgi:hypothetical protein
MTPWTIESETDSRFPSGAWNGFFLQPSRPGRNWMELRLRFFNGKMDGHGRDFVGKFNLNGKYDLETGKCSWSKQYLGQHDVAYQGYNEGKGIWGVWEIARVTRDGRGGFYIWPHGMADPTGSTLHAEEDRPVPELETVSVWSDLGSEYIKGF